MKVMRINSKGYARLFVGEVEPSQVTVSALYKNAVDFYSTVPGIHVFHYSNEDGELLTYYGPAEIMREANHQFDNDYRTFDVEIGSFHMNSKP
jgi:hypothetical protein